MISFVGRDAVLLAVVVALAGGGLGAVGEVRHVPVVVPARRPARRLPTSRCVLVTVRTLGAGGMVALRRSPGQLPGLVVIDQFGVLGVAKNPITAARLLGVGC